MGARKREQWGGLPEVGRQGQNAAGMRFRWGRYLPCSEGISSSPLLAPPSGLPTARPGLPQLQRQPSPVPVLQTKDRAWALLGSLPRQRRRQHWGWLDSLDPQCPPASVPLTGSCVLGLPVTKASHESHMTILVAGDLQRR